jgi:KTSC domain
MRHTPRPLPALHAPFSASHPEPGDHVKSSNVKSIAYDAASHSLQVEFHSGSFYTYQNVPSLVHSQLMQSPSKGRFVRLAIAPRFIAVKRAPGPHPS